MYKIPDEFRGMPEADRLRKAQANFSAAADEAKGLTLENKERVRLIGERLRNAQTELHQAQKAFDLVTGEPKPVGLTPVVTSEIRKQFPIEQQDVVEEIIGKECGRTIPFERDATAEQLEFIRLCVLRLSKGNHSDLRRWVELANIDQRDVLLAAGSFMKE
jgi:hypothetical protein